jgi:DNA-directed RNA polymerase specialized sigma54-like protein
MTAAMKQTLHGQLKMAQLAAMPESDFEKLQQELEDNELFSLLKKSGVIRFAEFSRARFAAKQFAGVGLKLSGAGSGIAELVNGQGETVSLIKRIGEEAFERWFLKSEASEVEVAGECDLKLEEVRLLRDFVDKAYIQAEFDSTSTETATAPAAVFSAVAGIEIEKGEPVLSFFHREIWKGRYSVDDERLSQYLDNVPPSKARAAKSIVGKLGFIEKRKTTLYGLLEILLAEQKNYLKSGDPQIRKPLTQRELSRRLDVHPSVLNRLVSNKSVQLPWGLEAPLDALIPSGKDIGKELLYTLMSEHEGLTDTKMAELMNSMHGIKLSRRSIAQYRKELRFDGNKKSRKH